MRRPSSRAARFEPGPLDLADRAFTALVTGPQPLSLDGRDIGQGLPRRPIPLHELKSVLLHPSCSYTARDAAWAELIRHARSGNPAWVVGATGVALPGLRRAAARLTQEFPGSADDTVDIDSEVLTGFLTALRSIDVTEGRVGGRVIGRNELPNRAIVESYEQAIALLGVRDQVLAYKTVLSVVAVEPAVSAWVAANPVRALEAAELWPGLLSAYGCLRAARGSGRYLREIAAPGVDTKFVERHRPLLAQLLGVPSSPSSFLTALGLRTKPETLRLRPDASLGLAAGLSEITARPDELAALDIAAKYALVIENEITFLSVPVRCGGVVLWGKGFEVDRVGSMPWLVDAEVDYWGDLDTHGFAILNRLRAWLPQTRALLMDHETLLAHRDRWVTESQPTTSHLDRLTGEEQALYQNLVTDRLGRRVRLEQERIDWNWVTERLPY